MVKILDKSREYLEKVKKNNFTVLRYFTTVSTCIADYVVANRNRATFLDGVPAMIGWNRIEKVLRRGLGRSTEITAGAKAYPAIQMFKILLLQQWYGLSDQAVFCSKVCCTSSK